MSWCDLTWGAVERFFVPQGANTGAVSMGGHLMIGTTSGSTTQCEGVVTGSGVNASCFYNQAPACTILLSR
jgi:hypothetical protein